jgi:hypothetical protein
MGTEVPQSALSKIDYNKNKGRNRETSYGTITSVPRERGKGEAGVGGTDRQSHF